ncbi:MAG: potassium-transporting ATPase subunit KdpB, partial [Ilumatobacter sp.]
MIDQTTIQPVDQDAGEPVRAPGDGGRERHPLPTRSIFDPAIVGPAIGDAVRKLDPRELIRNPVIFVVEIGSVLCTLIFLRDLGDDTDVVVFNGLISVFLWLTVLFANFAEAMAEGRGKAQAASLRDAKKETMARRRNDDGDVEDIASNDLHIGDEVVVTAGEVIPGDGDIVEGIATIDESAITGESAPVVRESGGDRSAVTGGTTVLSDEIVVRITAEPGSTFLDRMISLVEGAERQRTPNELALSILLAGLSIVFLVAVVTLQPFAIFSGAEQDVVVLVALLVALIPTTIGGLLSAIGIAGMDRLVQRNVLAKSGRAVEAAGDVSTLLLDKTGTITYGNRRAVALVPVHGVTLDELADAAIASSAADETPEGRSIVALATGELGRPEITLPADAELVEFTAQTRMSGVDLPDGRRLRKGAADTMRVHVDAMGGATPPELTTAVDEISRSGGTPLVVVDGDRMLGVVHLKDVIKEGLVERFVQLREMGIRTVMITG